MAIRDIVTRGYGNGTYDPGVNDLPVRGYSIAAVSDVIHPEDTWIAGRRTNTWITNGRNMNWKSEQNPVTAISDR